MPPANREEAGAPPIRELSVPKDVGKTKKKKLPKKDTGSRGSSSSPQGSADYDEFDHDEQALLDLCFDEESRAAFASKTKKPVHKLQHRSSNSREGSMNDTASNASGRKGVKSTSGSITSDKRSKSSKQDNSVETERNNTEDFLAMFCGHAIEEADENKESVVPNGNSPQPTSKPIEEVKPIEKLSGHNRSSKIDAPSVGSRRSKSGRSLKSAKSARDENGAAPRKVAMTSQRNVNSRNVSSFAKPAPRDHDDGLDKDERGGKGGSGLGAGDELLVPLKRIPSWTSELTGLTSAFPGEYDEDEDEDDEDEDEEEEDEDEISYLDAFEEALPVAPMRPVRLTAPEESALRSGTIKRESGDRAVSFNVVSCRNYERIIDDNPSVTAGPGIGIGWRFNEGECVHVDNWEEERGERRRGTDLVLNREEREALLLEIGYTEKDLATAVRRIVKAKNQRKQTVNNLGAQSVEETLENATKKVRGFLKLVRRSKA